MKAINPALVACIDINIQFYDVDAMRIVWHGNYVKYLEDARCELLQKIQYDYLDMEASGYLWPIVDMRLKYVKSAKFGHKVRVEAAIVEFEQRLKIEYKIFNAVTNEILTKAYTVQVAVDIESGEMQFESPQVLIDKINQYLHAQ